ncbi:MAG: HAD family hydrolase [Planctomycetota bacterium]|jgi:phosphoglycolate phosphatase-like HAD superfamily hydrolase
MERGCEFFVGIDSDGCVFDTMEVKQRECFLPALIAAWSLEAVAPLVEEIWCRVNLYAESRGLNRFPALLQTFAALQERGVEVESLSQLRRWTEEETRWATVTLADRVAQDPDPALERVLAWSRESDRRIAERVRNLPPFPHAREALTALAERADLQVLSLTPNEALRREWGAQGLDGLVQNFAGQESGPKVEHLRRAVEGGYGRDRILMIGDAPGDLRAAETAGVLFFPILPGCEAESWLRFTADALPRFFAGSYRGAYQTACIAQFQANFTA